MKSQGGQPAVPGEGGMSLPIIQEGGDKQPIRPSKMGWKRAIVLGTIQLLIIAHVIQWLIMGTTISPVEPSEGMETVRDGVITAGFIFFVLALLSTLILGRWFCGWGCHVVMLQDACGWLMRKSGVRPKPFRSRLLMIAPLLLGLYMFVYPLFYRFAWLPLMGADSNWPGWSIELTTTNFWKSFPGLLLAIPFQEGQPYLEAMRNHKK